MPILIQLIIIAVGILGVAVAIWSIVDTRKKYYEEYLDRKRKHGN